ncbi:MAG: hypothetical protein PUB03_03280 [bacterium]|nr:hypothetical protein [bacterium]
MGKWEMGYGSTLEQRAKKNGRDIDMQWIKEHEADELLRNNSFFNPSNSLLEDDDIAKWQKSTKSPEQLQKRINDILAKLNNDDITFEDRNEYMFELEEAKNELKKQKEFSDLESLKSNRFGGGNPGYRYNGESHVDNSKVDNDIAELKKASESLGQLQERISAIIAELSNGDTTAEETKEESEEQSVTSTLESLKSNKYGGGNPEYRYNGESHTDSSKVNTDIDNLLKEFSEMSNDTINHSSASRKGK